MRFQSACKSDLALRFNILPGDGEYLPLLVADDQVFVATNGNDELIASFAANHRRQDRGEMGRDHLFFFFF